ncbi:ABC transporter family substrate-binding protein [Populibacterium corticicola]|uniref:ABC transporter family substrate-binding protein n=1 Tax=Populibacterium corticicola TaxID=1812826 RepID=A0ABW5XI13_9MICO
MKIKKWAAPLAVVLGASLALSACSTPTPNETTPSGEETTTSTDNGSGEPKVVTVGWNQAMYSANDDTNHGNAAANAVINYLIKSEFFYYDGDLNVARDESVGTYEVVSEDPLKVQYTFADTAKWADGTPVDAADLLLSWAGVSGVFNDDVTERDEEGNLIIADDQVFFASPTAGGALVQEFPEISDDRKSITFTYTKVFGDWEINLDLGVAAHATAKIAGLGDDAAANKDAVVKAFQDNDRATLAQIANAWRTGFDFVASPSEDQALGNGPFKIVEYVESQYITLERNENYEGNRTPKIDRVVVRYSEDPQAQVQALQNGEIDMLAPQATADTLTQLQALQGVTVETGVDGTYEHIDMVQDNGGPFDPATYGGDAEKAQKVRQAFLLSIPREAIVEQLIKPLNPNATTRDSFVLLPDDPNYSTMVEQNGSADYAKTDIEKAKELLAEVGVDNVDVRFLYGKSNVRRANQFVLIQESAAQAGFNVIDGGDDNWGTMLDTATDQYDANLFGWQSTSTAVTEADSNYRTGASNNFYGYSNKTVDALFDDLQTELDPAKQLEIQIGVEKELFKDAFGITIFQFPAVNAWNSQITGVQPISISPTIFHGFWNWDIAE